MYELGTSSCEVADCKQLNTPFPSKHLGDPMVATKLVKNTKFPFLNICLVCPFRATVVVQHGGSKKRRPILYVVYKKSSFLDKKQSYSC